MRADGLIRQGTFIAGVFLWHVAAHTGMAAILSDWILFPEYQLPGEAANHPGPRPGLPPGLTDPAPDAPPAFPMKGFPPTHRWFPQAVFPQGPPFTLELWTVDHSHYPTGVGILARDESPKPLFYLLYHDNSMEARLGEHRLTHHTAWRSAFNRYWRHIVLVVDTSGIGTLYYNGNEVDSGTWPMGELPSSFGFEIAAYNARDHRMRIENILHRCRVYDEGLSPSQVKAAFSELGQAVYEGVRYPGLFHFTAGPALSFVTGAEALLSVEADRSTQSTVRWGTDSSNMEKALSIPTYRKIHNLRIGGLEQGKRYFYRVELEDRDGSRIDSGLLSFRTAPDVDRPVTFAAIGDTESRPWINDVVCKRIWEHGVDFVVHLGDLTDNGRQDRKPQWTHEYFAGMTQLQSRIPVFAVPGNGEGDDLYWFKRYFPHPRDQGNRPGFYRFTYGAVDFFMLDSNARGDEFRPGGRQYDWLAGQLEQSEAPWKVVCFHHVGTPGTFGDNPAVNALVPLFDRFGVDLVLNGHKHAYERSHPRKAGKIDPDGTTYIVSGGAGGNLKDEGGSGKSSFSAHVYRGYNYLVVSAETSRLEITMHGLDGQPRDHVILKHAAGGWSAAFPEATPAPDRNWIHDPVLGWIYVAAWPWCYFLNTEPSYSS